MNIRVIRIKGNPESESAANLCVESGAKYGGAVERYDAVTPDEVAFKMKKYGLKWNYPWDGHEVTDFETGLRKTGYVTAYPEKRIACFLSHYELWRECVEKDNPSVILEHDALWQRRLVGNPADLLYQSRYDIISLNDPRGATRKSMDYHNKIQAAVEPGTGITAVPVIDDLMVPQGLPGNSAYYIKPRGAEMLIDLVDKYGAWPNDAIMCRQLMRGRLGCATDYYTRIQGRKSSTTL